MAVALATEYGEVITWECCSSAAKEKTKGAKKTTTKAKPVIKKAAPTQSEAVKNVPKKLIRSGR